MLSKVAVLFTFLLITHEGSNYSTSLSTLCYCHFYFSLYSRNEVVSHCGFYLNIPNDNNIRVFFILISSFEKLHILCKFIKLGGLLLFIIVMWEFKNTYIPDTSPLWGIWFANNLSYYSVVVFSLSWQNPLKHKSF